MDISFWSGLGCGISIGVSLIALKKYIGIFSDAGKTVKKVNSVLTIWSQYLTLAESRLADKRHNRRNRKRTFFKPNPKSKTQKDSIHSFQIHWSSRSEFKVVLVVRTDLNMSKGKIAAQCAHAAVGVFEKAQRSDPEALKIWQITVYAAVKIASLEEMKEISSNAKKMGLLTTLIRDAGRTQIAPNSVTVLGVGPAPTEVIDKVTGHLKLL